MCLSVNPIYNQACNSGLNATALQTHFKQNLDLLQEKIETEVEKKTGKEIWTIALTSYQMISKQAFVFSTDIKPIANTISGNLTKDSINLTLTWLF